MLTLLVIVAIVAAAFIVYKNTKKENSPVETEVKVEAPEKIEPIVTKKESPVKKTTVKKTTVKKQK
jgi:hypothetical protein